MTVQKQSFSLNKKTLLVLVTVATVSFILGNVWSFPLKFALIKFNEKSYAEHVFKCDNAMKEHYIAKAKIVFNANETTLRELEASELGLVECHYYDKFRKKLISYGLSENDLSTLALRSIELNKADLQKIVEVHEIND